VYGGRELRRRIRELEMGYVLAVRANHVLATSPGHSMTAAAAAALIPGRAWQRMRTGSGTKGVRHYGWAMLEVTSDDTPDGHDDGHSVLLIRRRAAAQHPRPQRRIQVGAVVGMPVTDEHRVEFVGADVLQQARHGRVPGVHQQPEPVVLHEEPAARLARLRPRAAPARDCEPHPVTLQGASSPWRKGCSTLGASTGRECGWVPAARLPPLIRPVKGRSCCVGISGRSPRSH